MKSTPHVLVFDSGIGGLTVLSACRRKLPNEKFLYFGDNANAPYGNKSPEEIRFLVKTAFEKLSDWNIKAVVLGCNTATALCADELRARYSFPIVGAEPAVFPAVRKMGEVTVLSTVATAQSPKFSSLIERVRERYPHANIEIKPCPLLAETLEKHLLNPSFDYAPYLPAIKTSAIVLGCTHFVFIKRQIYARYGVPVYDGNDGIAERLKVVLRQNGVVENGQSVGEITFLGDAKTVNKTVFEHMFANLRG